ncbi:MAG: hypothetical protein HXX13_01760 [Bacteroidetes bacterium]|nr:hypothetical protein [Bacteroidota bacterium]
MQCFSALTCFNKAWESLGTGYTSPIPGFIPIAIRARCTREHQDYRWSSVQGNNIASGCSTIAIHPASMEIDRAMFIAGISHSIHMLVYYFTSYLHDLQQYINTEHLEEETSWYSRILGIAVLLHA